MKKLSIILTLMLTLSLYGCGSQDSIDEQPSEQTLAAESPENDTAEVLTAVSYSVNAASAGANNNMNVENETVSADSADNETAEEPSIPAYTVTAYDEAQVMYATGFVNVRKGPSTDYKSVGVLSRGQEVTVTGQADTKWYEIQYNEETAYVSNKYLQSAEGTTLPAAADAQPAEEQQAAPEITPVTEVKNVSGVIFVGDSRFVQMQASVGENPYTWIAESAKGYKWFEEKAIPRIDGCVGNGSKILINLGVNDPGNLQKYITLVNAKAAEWTSLGATVYYASVNPVWSNPYVTEEQVEYFNSQMQTGLSSDIHWIDSHSYLISIGYRLVDGLHYSTETYQNLYAYYMSCM